MSAHAQQPKRHVQSGLRYRLSRHIQVQPTAEGFALHSLITGQYEILPNVAGLKLLLSLRSATTLDTFLRTLGKDKEEVARAILDRWLERRFITEVNDENVAEEDSIDSLRHWEPHDLAFHLRSRRGRNPYAVGATWRLAAMLPPEPVRRTEPTGVFERISLPRLDIEQLRSNDLTLTEALERRRSRYSIEPLAKEQLADLLFRACRVTGKVGLADRSGELIRKVYPSGGSLHSLETYVVADRCGGLPSGAYRYDPFEHQLELVRQMDAEVRTLLEDAQRATLKLAGLPPALLIFAPRFRRVARKYDSLAYHVILQEVGALYQTIYLVAESLGLAVSAIGSGDSDRFSRVFGTDFFAESSVGEMIVGGALEQ